MASNYIKKEYIPTKEQNKYIKCELYYSLGGMNYFSYKQEQRGYYVSVCPVERENRGGYVMESFTAFSGVKMLVTACARKSKKAEQDALNHYEEAKNTMLARFSDLLPNSGAESAA